MTEKEVLHFIGIIFSDYDYIATDKDGEIYLYDAKPYSISRGNLIGHWVEPDGGCEFICLPISLPYCKEKIWDKTLRKLR